MHVQSVHHFVQQKRLWRRRDLPVLYFFELFGKELAEQAQRDRLLGQVFQQQRQRPQHSEMRPIGPYASLKKPRP